MPDNPSQKSDVCAPIVDAAHRQFTESGLARVVANFDFVKELINNRTNGNNCYSRVLDQWNQEESKGLSETAKDRLFEKHPNAKDNVKSGSPSADSLLGAADRNHDLKISAQEVINRAVELDQINESGIGDKRTHDELTALGEVFGYLKYKKLFNPSNKSEPIATKAEIENVFYK